MVGLNTTGFHVNPALLMPLLIVSAAAGVYLVGTGFYDPFIDCETVEMFTKGRGILISAQKDSEPFHLHVGYRLFLGVVCMAIACGLFRMRHWTEEI